MAIAQLAKSEVVDFGLLTPNCELLTPITIMPTYLAHVKNEPSGTAARFIRRPQLSWK